MRQIDLIYTTVFILPVAGSVYLNISLLFPLLLEKKQVLSYLLLQLVSIAGFSWINMLIFSHFIDIVLPGYYFISYYDFQDLLKFFFSFNLVSTLLKLSKGWFQLIETRGNLERLEKMHAQAELESLKEQINPHFLFNSLNTLYAMVIKKSDTAPDYILKLSGLLRYLLYETSSSLVKLDKELANMSDYVDLQKLRAGPQASVSFEISGSRAGKRITPLLFLPLIENSFKHGIKGETGASFVNIAIIIREETIEFDIRNNCGYADDVEKKGSSGIGLENLRKRLDLVYPGKYSLVKTEDNHVFHVKLTVPLHHEVEMPDHRG
jgi:LytS/YehU family sensor histidine kinase